MRKDWCKLPYAIIQDDRLTPSDAVLYAVLNDILHDDRSDVQIASLAELTGLSPRQIHYSLNRLQEAGYIISRKTDGRKLIIEIEHVGTKSEPEQEQEQPKRSKRKPDPEPENPEHVEEALLGILSKKIKVQNPDYVRDVYNTLKAEAAARVRDQSKLLAYLSKMISNYVDNSDGFDPYDCEAFLNQF